MKIFIVVVGLVVTLILAAWGWFGGFSRVRFEVREAGGETIVVQRVTGDYSQSPAVMKRVYERLLADGIVTTRGIGIFYDKPSSVPHDEMRSDIGCIIDGIDLSTLAVLSAKYDAADSPDADADAEPEQTLSGESNFKLKTLPEGRFVVCEFPWRGSLSALVGIAKVYPALEKFCTANDIPTDSPVTEIYDIPRRKIIYRREI